MDVVSFGSLVIAVIALIVSLILLLSSFRPLIVLSFAIDDHYILDNKFKCIFLDVTNVGNRTAYDVKIDTSKIDLPDTIDVNIKSLEKELYSRLWQINPQEHKYLLLCEFNKETNREVTFEVGVTYYYGKLFFIRRKFSGVFYLDLGEYVHLLRCNRNLYT